MKMNEFKTVKRAAIPSIERVPLFSVVSMGANPRVFTDSGWTLIYPDTKTLLHSLSPQITYINSRYSIPTASITAVVKVLSFLTRLLSTLNTTYEVHLPT